MKHKLVSIPLQSALHENKALHFDSLYGTSKAGRFCSLLPGGYTSSTKNCFAKGDFATSITFFGGPQAVKDISQFQTDYGIASVFIHNDGSANVGLSSEDDNDDDILCVPLRWTQDLDHKSEVFKQELQCCLKSAYQLRPAISHFGPIDIKSLPLPWGNSFRSVQENDLNYTLALILAAVRMRNPNLPKNSIRVYATGATLQKFPYLTMPEISIEFQGADKNWHPVKDEDTLRIARSAINALPNPARFISQEWREPADGGSPALASLEISIAQEADTLLSPHEQIGALLYLRDIIEDTHQEAA